MFSWCFLLRFTYSGHRLGEHLFKCVIKFDEALVENLNFLLHLLQHASVLVKDLKNSDNGAGSDSTQVSEEFV